MPRSASPSTFAGTCTTCHDTPNVGNHSFPLPLDIGTAHSVLPSVEPDPNIAAGLAELSMPDLPVYLISGCPNPFNPGQVGIVLHERSGQGAHLRAVQRLQPRQRPDPAWTRGPRPVFPQRRRRRPERAREFLQSAVPDEFDRGTEGGSGRVPQFTVKYWCRNPDSNWGPTHYEWAAPSKNTL